MENLCKWLKVEFGFTNNDAVETIMVGKTNPDILSLYLDFSKKTLQMDIEWLAGQGLLRKEKKGYVLNKEILRSHMPKWVHDKS